MYSGGEQTLRFFTYFISNAVIPNEMKKREIRVFISNFKKRIINSLVLVFLHLIPTQYKTIHSKTSNM